MLQVALAQVRLNARRFIAVSLAVMIAVGFLTATLIINSSSKASLTQSIGEGFRNADLVLTAQYVEEDQGFTVLDDDEVSLVRGSSGVAETYAVRAAYILFNTDGASSSGQLTNIPDDPSLLPVEVQEGNLPAGPDEVAVDGATADRLDLSVGSSLGISTQQDTAAGEDRELVVSAILAESRDPLMMGAAQLYAEDAVVAEYADPEYGFSSIQLGVSDGAAVRAVQTDLEQAFADAGTRGVAVRTVEEQTNYTVDSFTGGSDQLTIVLLAFAAVALLVCALVVSNTFSVLVAQRTRELALLRCIGADRAQIRRSVMVEALVVGVVASILGVGVAIGLMSAIVAYLRTIPESGFATLAVSPLAVAAGLGVGILLTVLSALVPARAATAVSPLAALRPAEDVRAGTRKGRARLVSGLVLTVGGGLLLGAGAVSANLLIALPGGILSFVGILMCGTLFIPPLVRAVGSLAAPLGVPGKLAAVNAIRNPQRTAATSSALLIGVTLVTMMMTGAATSRSAFEEHWTRSIRWT
ncbi:ABC transporter permease [Arthrobacter sp. ATA002]|uniref:FtsX-like permease family protein n=1 Tax=Arthrobacter sp. ATA002 TaxID=2991715 RepID=UPI0022A69AE3|nr:ABC transporter permease [Arthrobacter sp. ATA002]WAP52871.1 ABC transporter permease [Arthrobacter sp. ATA002]